MVRTLSLVVTCLQITQNEADLSRQGDEIYGIDILLESIDHEDNVDGNDGHHESHNDLRLAIHHGDRWNLQS